MSTLEKQHSVTHPPKKTMKKALLFGLAAILTLSFGACQTTKTRACGGKSAEDGDCCKSDAAPVKKLRFR